MKTDFVKLFQVMEVCPVGKLNCQSTEEVHSGYWWQLMIHLLSLFCHQGKEPTSVLGFNTNAL